MEVRIAERGAGRLDEITDAGCAPAGGAPAGGGPAEDAPNEVAHAEDGSDGGEYRDLMQSVEDVEKNVDITEIFALLPGLTDDQTPAPRGQIRERQGSSPPGGAAHRVLQMGSASPRSPRGSSFEEKATALVTAVRDSCDVFLDS